MFKFASVWFFYFSLGLFSVHISGGSLPFTDYSPSVIDAIYILIVGVFTAVHELRESLTLKRD